MQNQKNKKRISSDSEHLESLPSFSVPIRPSELARKLLIKGESWREFEKMRAKVLSEIGPQTEIENILCEKIISATWKMRRAMIVEKNLLNKENEITFEEKHPDPWSPPGRKRIRNIDRVNMQSPEVQNLLQYQIELEKALQKALERLRRLRSDQNNGKNEQK